MTDVPRETMMQARMSRREAHRDPTPAPPPEAAALLPDIETLGDRPWHVAITYPNEERRARTQLQFKGYSTWLPMCLVRKRHARQVWDEYEPLAPRYLLVGLGLDADGKRLEVGPVYSTRGVWDMVRGTERKPARARKEALLRFHEWLSEHAGVRDLRNIVRFSKGERALVIGGLFSGNWGTCRWASIDEVKLDLDNGKPVVLPIAQVRKGG